VLLHIIPVFYFSNGQCQTLGGKTAVTIWVDRQKLSMGVTKLKK
jgi:hypothetical protein